MSPSRRPDPGIVALGATLALLAAAPGPASATALSAAPVAAAATAAQDPLTTVDSLAALGRLQEAAWHSRAAGDTARAQRLLERLDGILRSEPVSANRLAAETQGVSLTYRLDHGQGVASIFKVEGSDIFCRTCGADREVASYAVDRLLGLDLTPMTVPTMVPDDGDTLSGSAMYFIHDAASPRELGTPKPDLLRFFDAVIGNSDRHMNNWLIRPDGGVVAIDHNRAFRYGGVDGQKTCWETEIDSIARPADLGRPFQRFRTLPDDSLIAAVGVLGPELAYEFLSMRHHIIDRILRRAERPRRSLPHEDCTPDR